MNISVLGAGNGGTAVAAELSLQGHEVNLIKTSHAMNDENFNHLLQNGGVVHLLEKKKKTTARIKHVTRDLSRISQSQLIIIYIQTNYHEDLIKRIRPFLRDGQILLLNPGYLSTAYVLKHCPDIDLIVCEAQSSFLDCRITKPGTVKIGFRNVRNPLGIYPVKRRKEAQTTLDQLDFPFVYLPSVIEAALHNPNLIVHTVGAIMSIPRIEKTKGDYCMYHEVFTPGVWRILEALDEEKMAVMEKLGCKRLSYVEACKYRNTLDDNRGAKEVFFWYAGMPTRAKGPTTVDSRYISEDVPQGLVLLETLGQKLKIETPICSSLIHMASAALDRDLREEGRSIKRMGEHILELIIQDSRDARIADTDRKKPTLSMPDPFGRPSSRPLRKNYPFFAEIVPHAEQDLKQGSQRRGKTNGKQADAPEQEGQRCSNNNGCQQTVQHGKARTTASVEKSVQWKNHRNHQIFQTGRAQIEHTAGDDGLIRSKDRQD